MVAIAPPSVLVCSVTAVTSSNRVTSRLIVRPSVADSGSLLLCPQLHRARRDGCCTRDAAIADPRRLIAEGHQSEQESLHFRSVGASLFACEVGALAHRGSRRRAGIGCVRSTGSDREDGERETHGYNLMFGGAQFRAIVLDAHDVLGRPHSGSPSVVFGPQSQVGFRMTPADGCRSQQLLQGSTPASIFWMGPPRGRCRRPAREE